MNNIQEAAEIRKKKVRTLVTVIVISVIAIIGISLTGILREIAYRRAVDAFDKADYSTAISYFEKVTGYKDSDDILQKAHYNLGVIFLDDGDNDSALDEFNAAGELSDAPTLAKESLYRRGIAYMQSGNYQSAQSELEQVGDYKDAPDQVKECKYQQGMSMLNGNDSAEAYRILAPISGYKDTDTYLKSHYQDGLTLLQNRDYVSAKEVFDSIYEYKDSSDKSVECQYLEGVRLYNNDELYAAYRMLEPIADYRDVQSYISSEKRNIFGIIQTYIDNGMNVIPVRDDIIEWDRRGVNIFDCIERDFNAANRDSSTVSSKYHIDVYYTVMDETGVPYYDLTCRNEKNNLRYYLIVYQFDSDDEADQMAAGFNTVEDSGDKLSSRNYACGSCVVTIMGHKEEIKYLDMY